MRQLTLATLLAAGLLTGPLAPPAAAVTVEELFTLKANGLSDDILVALIQTDGSVFQMLPEDVVTLHRRGLSEKVILAMIATNRTRPQRPVELSEPASMVVAPPSAAPTVVQPVQVVNSSPSVEVYVPVAVPVAVVVPNRHHQPGHVEKPVYWGFGGQLRPDAWGQPPQRQREPDRRGSDNDRKSNDRDPSPTVRRR